MKRVAVLFGVIFILVAQTAPDSRSRADRLFEDSHRAVTRLPQPPFIAFTLQDDGHTDRAQQEEKLRVLVRTSDGYAIVVPLKNQDGSDIAHPTPYLIKGPHYADMSYIVGLGDFPLDDFGMRIGGIHRQGMFDAPGTPEPEPSGMRSIMTVHAYNPGYRVADLGDTTIDGRSVHHLGLTPLRDQGHRPLREIWIDAQTMLPVRYIAAIPVTYANDTGFVSTHWATIYTRMIDGHVINERVDGRFKIRVGMLDLDGVFNWSVSQVSFPAAEPDWVFDLGQWKQHTGESIPNLAPNS